MSRPRNFVIVAVALLASLLVAGACDSSRKQYGEGAQATDTSTPPYNSGAIGGGLGTGGGGGGGVGGVAGEAAYNNARVRVGGVTQVPAAAPAPMVGDASVELRQAGTQNVDVASLPIDAAAPMIVRTGTATVKVDSLVPAIARLRVMARQLGGYVGTTAIQVGSEQVRSASVELKVPAARWNELLEGMKPIGTLEHQEESAQDVGEEFVDVTARVANAKRLEARLLDLLATRTGKLSDALEVEQSIAQVRQEIERYQGRLRYLSARSAMSTMTVSLHEPAPLVGSHPGDNPIADAARTAWHLFVGLLALLISSLGIVIPLGLLVALLWWIRRNWGRRPAAA